MSMPTSNNLKDFIYVYEAQPFCDVPAKSGISLKDFIYVYEACPFVSNDFLISYCFGVII